MSRYNTQEWHDLAAAVKARDGNQCTSCGRRGGLDAHHIVPAGDGGAFWDIDNLRALCRDCHMDQHPGWREGLPRRRPSFFVRLAKGFATALGGALQLILFAIWLGAEVYVTWIAAENLQAVYGWHPVAAWIIGFFIASVIVTLACGVLVLVLSPVIAVILAIFGGRED